MLIIKGKFPSLNFFALLTTSLLALLLALPPALAAAARPLDTKAGARGPEVVATEFYGWYLEALSADQDPLSDRYDTFTRYVARELAARLVERLQSGQLPQRDYFIQSASYRPAWQRSVRAVTVRRRAGAAEVLVTLGEDRTASGEDAGPRQVLALSMVLENGAWKIRQVAAVDAAGSSAEQPVI